MVCTSDMSRPSRCMAPPSAQKSFCTSTSSTAACSGRTLSLRVVRMCFSSRCPVCQGFQIMALKSNGFTTFCRTAISRLAVRLGTLNSLVKNGRVLCAHHFGLDAGEFRDPIVSLLLRSVHQIDRGLVDRALEAAGDVGVGLQPAFLG